MQKSINTISANIASIIKNEVFKIPTSKQDEGAFSLGLKINAGLDYEKIVLGYESHAKAFIMAAFISCGTSNITIGGDLINKSGAGYHVQFVLSSKESANFLVDALCFIDIFTKIISRGKNFVVDISSFETVCDFLKALNLQNSLLLLENENAARNAKIKVNREINSAVYNLNKQQQAAEKQLEAINKLNETMGLDDLPEELKETAFLRLNNKELSSGEMADMLGITKSGLNNRLKKLIELSEMVDE
jgi:DNA-binding protein WhiA